MASPQLRLCIPIDTAGLEESREEVRLFLQAHGVEEKTVQDLVLCVHEACANAIEHSSSRTDIDVELCVGPTSVTVVVADKGLGLDLDLYDPQRKPELLQSGGRGLYVIACLMDELEVHLDGGTVIRMNKQRPTTRTRAPARPGARPARRLVEHRAPIRRALRLARLAEHPESLAHFDHGEL